jgi:vancomycin resistance protein VanW
MVMVRELVPAPLRRFGALRRRALRDWWHGRLGPWAQAANGMAEHDARLKEIARYACPILDPEFQRHVYDNKMHNLELVRSRLDGVTIRPGELFSFWRLVGRPDEAHGFKVASNFIGGRLAFAVGGGICQLTGALYNAALLAGLDILERHAHSIDAYGPSRYVPLGRDATVAYGYKDLQFRNATGVPMTLRIHIGSQRVEAAFYAPYSPFENVRIEVVAHSPDGLHTSTRREREGRWELVSEDRYALPGPVATLVSLSPKSRFGRKTV